MVATPMAFGIGILMTGGISKGGVHKIRIFIADLVKDKSQNIFGEEMGGQWFPDPLVKIGFVKGIHKEITDFF